MAYKGRSCRLRQHATVLSTHESNAVADAPGCRSLAVLLLTSHIQRKTEKHTRTQRTRSDRREARSPSPRPLTAILRPGRHAQRTKRTNEHGKVARGSWSMLRCGRGDEHGSDERCVPQSSRQPGSVASTCARREGARVCRERRVPPNASNRALV